MSTRWRIFALGVSLVLLIIVLFYLARSFLPEHQQFRSYRGNLVLICVSGRFGLWLDPNLESYRSTAYIIDYAERSAKASNRPLGKLLGIGWINIDFKTESPGIVMISYWYLALPPAIISLWSAVILRRRRSREQAGHCRGCGYDLRASQDKCPECGTSVSTAASALTTSPPAAG